MSVNTEQNRSLLLALKVLLLVAFANSLYIFSTGWSHPFFELHPFRQFQTALSITTIVQGGPWFAYETPILGPPWSIPFELPVYQWITALLIHVTDLKMEHASRLVSVTFFYSSLYLSYTTLRLWQCGLLHRLCFVILMLFRPIYLFWSRTCMIGIVAWNLYEYRSSYLPLQKFEARPGPRIEAARRLIPEDEVALIYGADWSSEIAYQIARKVIMDRDRRSLDDPIMAASLRQLGDRKVGAVLDCVRGTTITRHATFAQTLQRLAMSPQPVLTHATRWPPSGLICELFTPAARSASQ